MSSPPSACDASDSFDRLHPKVRQWIWEQNWQELREVQDLSIQTIFDGNEDVLIAASTAAGKTEAAFFPILTSIADRELKGLAALYISPLKALINDQFSRLEQLCERLEISVVRWHGDAPQSAKQRALKNPDGIALITPESIEALLIRRPKQAKELLGGLDFIVIDELHAFLQGPRGLHLSSLLRRIDEMSAKRPRRVGLSATIGDLSIATEWLNPSASHTVRIVEPSSGSPELRLQVKAYVDPPNTKEVDDLESEDGKIDALGQIADHVFGNLRGANNLLFGGSRRRVEAVADRLTRRSEAAAVPNEFFPHHGSLSKELRETLEKRLKESDLPTTAVATTTLELGIDIGSVKSVAQIGAPRSLSSLRQRLGRSGRRPGQPSILRIYLREKYITSDSDPLDSLRLEVVRAVASIRLLIERFIEPPRHDPSIATVVLHQTLSLIIQYGGAKAEKLYRSICGDGPLSAFSQSEYVELLRSMASAESKLIEMAPDRTIMLGEFGERLAFGREFYAIFPSDDEWKLIHGSHTLGTVPIANAFGIGSLVAFAGRRWRVVSVDDHAKVVGVEPHKSAQIPKFEDVSLEPIHNRLAEEMLEVLKSEDMPAYLDTTAQQLLAEGRTAFRGLRLSESPFMQSGDDTHLLTWKGTAINSVLAVAISTSGVECYPHSIGVTVAETSPADLIRILNVLENNPISANTAAAFVENLQVAKYDELIPTDLLRRQWAKANQAEVSAIPSMIRSLNIVAMQ